MRPDDIPELPKRLYELDDWHSPLEWGIDALLVATSIAATLRWPLMYPLAVLFIGARQRGLACLLHSATHRSLARSRWLNWFLGTWGSGYLVFQTWAAYFGSHVVHHHGHFGEAEDPDYCKRLAEAS
jgi:fatty acid desaturase